MRYFVLFSLLALGACSYKFTAEKFDASGSTVRKSTVDRSVPVADRADHFLIRKYVV